MDYTALPPALNLRICNAIHIGDCQNSQQVDVEVLTKWPINGLSQGQHVIAKLYDPMYIDDDDFINSFLVPN